MRKITAIPSKKIMFKNVPVTSLFFYKRTLYKKISIREASCYSAVEQIFFELDKIVRFIAKQHENIAIELFDSKCRKQDNPVFNINDAVEIIKKSVLGKIVSVNKATCLVQYKDKDVISFDEFDFEELKLAVSK
jgi:hypothetical protein